MIEDNESLMKMKWDSNNDDWKAKNFIKELGKLLAKLRAHVEIWSSKQHEYTEYSYSYTQPEEPTRAIAQLYNLARGHALLVGRNYITMEDVPLSVKVVLYTASIERVATFDLLLASEGEIILSDIIKALPVSKSTAIKSMTELAAVGLVDLEEIEHEDNMTHQIKLKQEFRWLLTEEFAKIREDFKPVDNSRYHKG